MSELQQKVAYLHGLAGGFNLEDTGTQGQLLLEIVDTLDMIADTIARVEETQEELEVYMESMDEDLSEMEKDFYGLDDELEFDTVSCPVCNTLIEVDNPDDHYFEGEERRDLNCPECGAPMNGVIGGVAKEERSPAKGLPGLDPHQR